MPQHSTAHHPEDARLLTLTRLSLFVPYRRQERADKHTKYTSYNPYPACLCARSAQQSQRDLPDWPIPLTPPPFGKPNRSTESDTSKASARSTSPHRTSASTGRHGQAATAAPGNRHPTTRTCGLVGHPSETRCSRGGAPLEMVGALSAAEGGVRPRTARGLS